MAGFLFGVCSACCEEPFVCGTACTETITVNVSVAGYGTVLVFTVLEGSAFHSEPGDGEFDFFSVSAFLTCFLVDGVPTWELVVNVCWKDDADEGSEQWEGTVEADPDGCPPNGTITLLDTLGDGVTSIAASVA